MAKKIVNYEEMLDKLKIILEHMDTKEMTLTETMKNYEEGIKICNELYKILNEAECKINIVTENGEIKFPMDKE